MRIEPYEWPTAAGTLAADYQQHFPRAAALYEYDWRKESELERRAQWLDRRASERADRQEIAEALLAYQQRIGASEQAFASVAKLSSPDTVVVVGGQQAGLFTGPLLVIYKAVTLIREAREAERQLGRPVVPLFWIAGEDHDFDEVNHTYYLSGQQQLEKIRLEGERTLRTAVSRQLISGEEWEAVLLQLEQSLLPAEHKAALLDKLRAVCVAGGTLTDGFAHTMAWLFGDYGLVLLDSDDPQLRRIEADMFAKLIRGNEKLNEALLEGAAEVERLGYTVQAEVKPQQANLFLFEDGERRLLVREADGTFAVRKSGTRYSAEQLERLCREQPELFSNNVLTRPLMQDYLFPVLSTVLGGGEIAYWGLLKRAFAAMGGQIPPLVPRLGFTLLEGTVQKHLDKFGWSVDDVVLRFDDKKQLWLKEQDTLQLEERFARVREQFTAQYGPLLQLVATINPGLGKLGDTNHQKIVEQISYMETKAIDALRSQHDASLRHLERLRLTMLPLGKPQERVYNVFSYLNRYGRDWISTLTESPLERQKLHFLLYL